MGWLDDIEKAQKGTTISKTPVRSIDTLYDEYDNFASKKLDTLSINDQINLKNDFITLKGERSRGVKLDKGLIDAIDNTEKKHNLKKGSIASIIKREENFGADPNVKGVDSVTNLGDIINNHRLEDFITGMPPERFFADKKAPGVSVKKTKKGWTYPIKDVDALNKYIQDNPKVVEEYRNSFKKVPTVGKKSTLDFVAEEIKSSKDYDTFIKNYNPQDPNYLKMIKEDANELAQEKAYNQYVDSRVVWPDTPQGYLPSYQDGGQFDGLTTKGFNYNGAWGGPAQNGKVVPKKKGLYESKNNSPSAYDDQKRWLSNWMNNPEYTKRLAKNMRESDSVKGKHDIVPEFNSTFRGDEFYQDAAKQKAVEATKQMWRTKVYSASKETDQDKFNDAFLNESPKEQRIDNISSIYGSYGFYNPETKSLFVNKRFTPQERKQTAVHELTHSTGVDDIISYITPPGGKIVREDEKLKKKYNTTDVRFNYDDSAFGTKNIPYVPNWLVKDKVPINEDDIEISFKKRQYLNKTDEVYPRIMKLRYNGGVKPGQVIDKKSFKSIKEKSKDDLIFDVYDDEQVIDMMNKFAVNNSSQKLNVAQNGKSMPSDNTVNNIQRGLDVLQLVSKYSGSRGPLSMIPGSAGSAFGLLDSFQNNKGVNPADVVGLLPGGVSQILSETIDQAAREKRLISEYLKKSKKTNPKIELKETAYTVKDNFEDGGSMDYAQTGAKLKDIRRPGDTLVLPPIKELRQTIPRYIPVSNEPTQVPTIEDPNAQKAIQEAVDWYSNPETGKRFQKNTGLAKDRLKDLVNYGTKIPLIQASSAYPLLGEDSQAEFQGYNVAPKEQIIYEKGVDNSAIGHEFPHAAGIDTVLGPSLKRVLGDATQQTTKNAKRDVKRYMNIPEETYGNFHQFRLKLGLKPGEKIKDVQDLERRAKTTKADIENFYQTFDNDKILKAINTIASTSNTDNLNLVQSGGVINDDRGQLEVGWLDHFDNGGNIPISSNGVYDYPEQEVIVPTSDGKITMNQVKYRIFGEDELGNKKVMHPNKNYQFPGKIIHETPILKKNEKNR